MVFEGVIGKTILPPLVTVKFIIPVEPVLPTILNAVKLFVLLEKYRLAARTIKVLLPDSP